MQTTRPDGDDNEKPLKLDAKEDEKEDFGLQGVENERQSEAIHSLSKSLNDGKNSRDIDWSPDSVKENIGRQGRGKRGKKQSGREGRVPRPKRNV